MSFYLAIATKGLENNKIFNIQFNFNVFEVTTFHTFASLQYVKTVANKKK